MNQDLNIKQAARLVEIPDDVINKIIEELTSVMKDRIENISPDDDPSAEYGACWTSGSCDSDDCLELDEPFDEYEIGYNYELSWRYREWTEFWSDPVCYPTFDEMKDERGEVYDISIFTPDGEEVNDSICERIAKIVNEKINR